MKRRLRASGKGDFVAGETVIAFLIGAMPSFSPPAEPGFQFSDDKLRIFQGDAIMVISAWPALEAVRKGANSPWWEPFQPAFRLVRPYRSSRSGVGRKSSPKTHPESDSGQLGFGFLEAMPAAKKPRPLPLARQRKRAFDQFRFALPKEVARSVESFPGEQWPLLLMMRHDPSSVDLALQNPTLAYLLAKKLDGDRDLIASLRCGTLRQREILGCLDFPESNGAVNLFRKIDPTAVNGDNWAGLLALLRRSSGTIRERLGHLDRINTGVIEILLNPGASAAVGQRLLQEVAENRRERYRARTVNLVTNTLAMQEAVRARRPVRRFPDLARLESVHQETSVTYREHLRCLERARKYSHENFRRPPIPGISGEIEPLTSPEALVDEGEEQGNCVASYAEKVMRGSTFIYRVLRPDRATLSIVRQPASRSWKVGELEGRFNTPASDRVERRVAEWLRRFQIEA